MTLLRNFLFLLLSLPFVVWGFFGESILHSLSFAIGSAVVIYVFIYFNSFCEDRLHPILHFFVGGFIELLGSIGIFGLILKLISFGTSKDAFGLLIILIIVGAACSFEVTFQYRAKRKDKLEESTKESS